VAHFWNYRFCVQYSIISPRKCRSRSFWITLQLLYVAFPYTLIHIITMVMRLDSDDVTLRLFVFLTAPLDLYCMKCWVCKLCCGFLVFWVQERQYCVVGVAGERARGKMHLPRAVPHDPGLWGQVPHRRHESTDLRAGERTMSHLLISLYRGFVCVVFGLCLEVRYVLVYMKILLMFCVTFAAGRF
jgi:hypothetical protein